MRKPAFCICENKGADQLHGCNRAADQCLCFAKIDSKIPLLSKTLAIFSVCCVGLVGSPEERFSHEAAKLMSVNREGF